MFSFRRKPKAPDHSGPPFIRTSPSLPELSTTGIPWPENLVDLSALPETEVLSSPHQGATRTSFAVARFGPIPFHKPWSLSPGKSFDVPAGQPISSVYMSHPPIAFETRKQPVHARVRSTTQRRVRNPTTFNIMVVGAKGTGKTSLLRLLLDTADISPTATAEQKSAMERFLRGPPKRTDSIQAACVEICESRYDRLLLSVIDTPGLNFQEGHELKLDRQVSSIVKYLDTQFADTMSEESKVVRQSKGDQHIHLCIYMIDPASIVTPSLRRAESSLPAKTRSETTVSYHPPDLSSMSDDTTSEETDEEADDALTMSPADIRVIRRLTTRANVLPVLARADSLTDDTLAEMKRVVRRDLHAANLDFGVFGPVLEAEVAARQANGNGSGHGNGDIVAEESEDDEAPEERRSRAVIKLRPSRHSTTTRASRSRSRMSLSEAANERAGPDSTDVDSVASVRFSAHIITKTDLSENLPFALITPEHVRRRRALKPSMTMDDRHSVHTQTGKGTVPPSEDGHANSVADSVLTSPTSVSLSMRNFPYLSGPPADLKGVFLRKFRWGTVDVLSPEHCDFAAMRTAVLSTHMKMLKIRTKEVLYEKYRTEKLLARRATQNISANETRKLLEGA
ncbi:Septin-domain-containing protein [Amylocystis lapponica]|nr:Septin-domain-containing protein [Amylocystis lapponica]